MAMKTRVVVEVPGTAVGDNGLLHHVRRALRDYAYTKGDTIVPELKQAFLVSGNVQVAEDRDGEAEKLMREWVIGAINHETAHQRINTSQSISKLRTEMENADDETSDEVHALEQRLVKLEDRYRDILRVLCETPETKKVLDELLGNEADRG